MYRRFLPTSMIKLTRKKHADITVGLKNLIPAKSYSFSNAGIDKSIKWRAVWLERCNSGYIAVLISASLMLSARVSKRIQCPLQGRGKKEGTKPARDAGSIQVSLNIIGSTANWETTLLRTITTLVFCEVAAHAEATPRALAKHTLLGL
jgi:hypothetical protein